MHSELKIVIRRSFLCSRRAGRFLCPQHDNIIGASVEIVYVRVYTCTCVRMSRPRPTARLRMRNSETRAARLCMGHDSVLITALANRGYGIAKTALPNHPPHVCVALLSRRATWLLYSLLVAVQPALRSRSPRNAQHFTSSTKENGAVYMFRPDAQPVSR